MKSTELEIEVSRALVSMTRLDIIDDCMKQYVEEYRIEDGEASRWSGYGWIFTSENMIYRCMLVSRRAKLDYENNCTR